MFGNFITKEKGKLILVLDVRSSSIGASLIRAEKSGVPKIIFSTREEFARDISSDLERFLPTTLKVFDDVVSKIFKAGLGVPENIFCVLASPWYVSQTRLINLKKPSPFVFTMSLADELIQKEVEAFKKEHLSQYDNTDHQVRIIELRSVKTMLNGYETEDPIDQKVEEVDMTLFMSMSPEHILQSFEKSVSKYFHHNTVKFSSFTMASFAVMKNIFPDQPNFLLIDVGGEVTDISMVKKNVLRESISFPLGHNYIIRGLALALGCPESEASSYMALLNSGHAEGPTETKLQPIIDQLKMEWLKKFQDSLANLSKDISVPYTIYLSANKELTSLFGKIIEAEQFNQYTLTESKFKITFLDTETLHGVVEFERDTERDSFLMTEVSYINHFLVYPNKI
jgi:hypothetical protein